MGMKSVGCVVLMLAAGGGLSDMTWAQSQATAVPSPAVAAALCGTDAAPQGVTLRGQYQLQGEGPLPIELALAPAATKTARTFRVTGLIAEGEHRFGIDGMAYCTGQTLALDVSMSGGFHDVSVDDELRRAWPPGKAPARASSAGASIVHAELALPSLHGWAEGMRTIVLTGQRVMGPKHVSATLAVSDAEVVR